MSRTQICCHCGQPFVPDTYNKHHQQYCTAPECQKARKRRNQQECRKRKMAAMGEQQLKEFHRSECLRINRIRKKSCGKCNGPPVTQPSLPELVRRQEYIVNLCVGLCANITALDNMEELASVIGKCCEDGYSLRHSRPGRQAEKDGSG